MHHPRHRQCRPVAPTYANTPPPQSDTACLAAGTSGEQSKRFAQNAKAAFWLSAYNQRTMSMLFWGTFGVNQRFFW